MVIEASGCGDTLLNIGIHRVYHIHSSQLQPYISAIFAYDFFELPESYFDKSLYMFPSDCVLQSVLISSTNKGYITERESSGIFEKVGRIRSHTNTHRFMNLREYLGSESSITHPYTHGYAYFFE